MPVKPSQCEHGILKKDCKKCHNAYLKIWRQKNPEKEIARRKKHRQKRLEEGPPKKKTCKVHGLIKGKQIDKWARCVQCTRVQNKKVYDKNAESWPSRTHEARMARYSSEGQKLSRIKYEKKMIKKIGKKAWANHRAERQRGCAERMTDGYIKFNMSRKYGLERKSIPKDMIDLERNVQKIKRIIKYRWKDNEFRREHRKMQNKMKELERE